MVKESDNPYWIEFAHKIFMRETWEEEVKSFILSLPQEGNPIWRKRARSLKKICEELVTLGYYVKYKYSSENNISFKLNPFEEKIDGFIYQNEMQIETVQISIAFYDKEENKLDPEWGIEKEIITEGGVPKRLKLISGRIKKIVEKKVDPKKGYKDIDTLLIGIRLYFTRYVTEKIYSIFFNELCQYMSELSHSQVFKQIVISDADLVGNGGHMIFPLANPER